MTPFITSDQRKAFRKWSEALHKIDNKEKTDEGEAWIAAAMAILNTPAPGGDAIPPGPEHIRQHTAVKMDKKT